MAMFDGNPDRPPVAAAEPCKAERSRVADKGCHPACGLQGAPTDAVLGSSNGRTKSLARSRAAKTRIAKAIRSSLVPNSRESRDQGAGRPPTARTRRDRLCPARHTE